jgi:hypothetical protein
MSDWIFLSRGNEDVYVNMFAKGCGKEAIDTDDFIFEDSENPIVLRGIMKKKIIQKCWRKKRDFYYIDTGYFGNERTIKNPNGWKFWHRVVKNDLQHNEIIARPDDRLKLFDKKFKPWKKDGRSILIALPDEKPMRFYNVDRDQWLEETINTIKQHTDRPIVIRDRSPNRIDRIATDTLQNALNNDVFALVTFNSNAATESIFHGIPAFTLAPTHAASPVCSQDLTKIDTPYYPDADKLYAWGCHLAYGQFHLTEFKNGKAKEILENNG